MKLHVLGICGTFMGGVAALARALGEDVRGSDANVYPPMSTQLEALGIELCPGYRPEHLRPAPDRVLVGNALSRGNAAIEYMLDADLDYTSGPQWLGERVLRDMRVLAVAGTHGKTTTSSLLAWLLEATGQAPGFLIGGVPDNFGISARLPGAHPQAGKAPFVIEADEYDTAFFDKRSKFVHYRPQIAVLNNLEYDHADIFPDLAAIERQFHHLVRTVPASGRLIVNAADENLARVLERGCWTPVETFGIGCGDWRAELLEADGSRFRVHHAERDLGVVAWSQLGRHNVLNALAALAALAAAGGDAAAALPRLAGFRGVARRLQRLARVGDIEVYDDFAHHPTAIATTLAGLRAHAPERRILVALEPRSNTMRMGVHAGRLGPALAAADRVVLLHDPALPWDVGRELAALDGRGAEAASPAAVLTWLRRELRPGDLVVFMSNGSFGGIARAFAAELRAGAQTGV